MLREEGTSIGKFERLWVILDISMLCHVTKPLNAIFLHEVFVTVLSSCTYENNLLHQINSNVGLSVVVNGTYIWNGVLIFKLAEISASTFG